MFNVLFFQVEYQTSTGQMLDLITTPAGEVDLSKYVLPTSDTFSAFPDLFLFQLVDEGLVTRVNR